VSEDDMTVWMMIMDMRWNNDEGYEMDLDTP